LIRLVPWPKSEKKRGRPYLYSPTVILRCFVVRIWLRLDSNRSLHGYLAMDYPYNRMVLRVCGLTSLPDRRTFDRRISTISPDIKERITTMMSLFIKEELWLLPNISSSYVCKAIYGLVPCSGIDTDARWGFTQSSGYLDTNSI
jgi:hypothetical protein